jgi:hypothetical protein
MSWHPYQPNDLERQFHDHNRDARVYMAAVLHSIDIRTITNKITKMSVEAAMAVVS